MAHNKKKNQGRKSGGGKGQALMEQMGLFPDSLSGGGMDDDDEDDDDLEAELMALAGGGSPTKTKQKKKTVDLSGLDDLVAASMKEIDDNDLSDTEDPDLLAELMELSAPDPPKPSIPAAVTPSGGSSGGGNQVALLEERLEMYKTAEATAKSASDTSKARRMNRGLKTLQDLLKKAKSGRVVQEDDIPPPVAASSKPSSQKTSPEEEQPPARIPPTSVPPSSVGMPPASVPPSSVGIPPSSVSPSSTGVPPSAAPRFGGVPVLPPNAAPRSMDPPPAVKESPPPVFEPTIKNDIPPQPANRPDIAQKPQSIPQTAPHPAAPQPSGGLSAQDAESHNVLTTRRDQYKRAALEAKSAGDETTAVGFIKISKQFDAVISALEGGKPIDLSRMPPPPPTITASAIGSVPVRTERSANQASSNISATNQVPAHVRGPVPTADTASKDSTPDEENIPELSQAEKTKLFKAPESAGSALEALQQRLDKYKASQADALKESNSSKAKRMGRIVKQYEDAIKAHKAGRSVDFEELPCPPGFPPIPVSKPAASQPVPQAAHPAASAPAPGQTGPKAAAPPPPAGARRPAPGPPSQQNVSKPKVQRQLSAMSRAEQQTIFLQERQLQFKKAALEAKRNGDLELAKKYLRLARGFDQMIDASMSGLPVDMSQIPAPPHAGKEDAFEFVEAEQCTGDRDEMYKKLEQEMIQQIKTCTANADSFTHLGDVSSATKFDRAGQNCRKDLDTLRNAYKHGDPVPRFHYENRSFSMVKCNTDLGDNDLEIVVMRGINYGLPSGYAAKDMDTYVKFEFPFPNDDPQCGQTDTAKHNIHPEYNQSFKVEINRKSRSFLRLLKSSKQVKFDVYYKRGFLKSDKLLGSMSMKLLALENKCEVHESVDLMDGRKTCGGKLEVKFRVRDAFISKQVEEVKEKWLVIDKFERALPPEAPKPAVRQKPVSNVSKPQPAPAPTAKDRPSASPTDYSSIEVLKYEKQQLDTQIRRYQGKLTKSEEDSLRHKGDLIVRRIDDMKARLQSGGAAAWRAYADAIERSSSSYVMEAKVLVQQGNRDKAQISMTKKKLIENEVQAIRARIPAR